MAFYSFDNRHITSTILDTYQSGLGSLFQEHKKEKSMAIFLEVSGVRGLRKGWRRMCDLKDTWVKSRAQRREKGSDERSGHEDGQEEILLLVSRESHLLGQLASRLEWFWVGKRRESQCVNNVETWEGLYLSNLKLCPKFGLPWVFMTNLPVGWNK